MKRHENLRAALGPYAPGSVRQEAVDLIEAVVAESGPDAAVRALDALLDVINDDDIIINMNNRVLADRELDEYETVVEDAIERLRAWGYGV